MVTQKQISFNLVYGFISVWLSPEVRLTFIDIVNLSISNRPVNIKLFIPGKIINQDKIIVLSHHQR